MVAIGAVAPSGLIATRAHTVRLVLIFLILAVGGLALHWQLQSLPAWPVYQPHSHIPLYLSVIGSEWLLFRGVCAGIRRSGMNWRGLVGASPFAWKGMLLDFTIAAAVAAAWTVPLILRSGASGNTSAETGSLLPRGVLEIVLWTILSLSAGICEEFTFRGYFQRQFAALTKRRWLGVILQAALFGAVHSYQGLPVSISIAAYGAVLGGLAAWRKNLRAVMITHAFTDLVMGIFLA